MVWVKSEKFPKWDTKPTELVGPIYLIQRGEVSKAKQKEIDAVPVKDRSTRHYWHLDYMGSAEFEFGALPEAIQCVHKNLKLYEFHDFKYHWKGQLNEMTLYSPYDGDARTKIFSFLREELEGKYKPLKEMTRMRSAFFPDFTKRVQETCIWWDIINQYFVLRQSKQDKGNKERLVNWINWNKEWRSLQGSK